jgi:predicted choloylglycine hydrolase
MVLLCLTSTREDKPGAKWKALFEANWPYYKAWFLSEGYQARPGYVTSLKKLRQHMPELLPIYEWLVELAGGGDLAARFLSLYRPPPYLMGCSQAVWPGPNHALVRNYDYGPEFFEGNLLRTCWHRPVIAMTDCSWGVLDGINDAGLAVSMSFGGRKIMGDGFGIPLILRYVLELCEDVAAATEILRRIPTHMPYNVTAVDREGAFAAAYLCPGHPAVVADSRVCTNHQQRVEWEDYARMSSTVERQEYLEARLADPAETEPGFVGRFLRPPLYNTRYEQAFGTLYTAAYYPVGLEAEYRWPHQSTLRQSFSDFREDERTIFLGLPAPQKQDLSRDQR